jgi:uncharacterized membrane protein YesL
MKENLFQTNLIFTIYVFIICFIYHDKYYNQFKKTFIMEIRKRNSIQ